MTVKYVAVKPTRDVCAILLLQKYESEWELKFSILNI